MRGQALQRDIIIIGAGPGGLQLGYFLEKKGRSFMILERGVEPGGFPDNASKPASCPSAKS